MSSTIRDTGEAHKNVAMQIQEFLYEGKSHKKIFRQHTIEEYQRFLDSLHDSSWEKYHNIAQYLGWE